MNTLPEIEAQITLARATLQKWEAAKSHYLKEHLWKLTTKTELLSMLSDVDGKQYVVPFLYL